MATELGVGIPSVILGGSARGWEGDREPLVEIAVEVFEPLDVMRARYFAGDA
jgi:hypothetical protein